MRFDTTKPSYSNGSPLNMRLLDGCPAKDDVELADETLPLGREPDIILGLVTVLQLQRGKTRK